VRVLITGAGGFIGSHLVIDQLARGHQVRATDIQVSRLECVAGHPSLEIVPGDLTEGSLLPRLLDGVDRVYHLASAHLDVSRPDAYYHSVNVEATRQLLRAASVASVSRFVHCSSNGILGEIDQLPADESTPCRPTNIYERTKLLGEQAALALGNELRTAVVVVRPAWVYGPGCPRTARLLRAARRGRFIMFGDGRTLRHPFYVADAVEALELCAERGEPGAVYFLAGDSPVNIETLLRTMAAVLGVPLRIIHLPVFLGVAAGYLAQSAFKLLGGQPPISRRTMDFFLKDNAYDTSKARREMGFAPRTDLASGIRQTVSAQESWPVGVARP
jgi:nucleoside-diphosphate-sugar epimerase